MGLTFAVLQMPPHASIMGPAVLSAVGCQLIFTACGQWAKRPISDDLKNRAVSSVHAALVGLLAAYTVYAYDELQIAPIGELNIACSIGYMAWDVVNMRAHGIEPFVPIAAHHILSAGGMAYMLIHSPDGTWPVSVLLISEMTTPILNMKALLEVQQKQNTSNYRLIRWLLLSTWIPFRLGVVAYFGYWTWTTWHRMSDTLIVLALMICPFLSVFNLVGLATFVTSGFPWSQATEAGEKKLA